MKRITFTVLAMILLASCSNEQKEYGKSLFAAQQTYKVIVVDSCEYISANTNNMNAVLTHKGNCRFCSSRK